VEHSFWHSKWQNDEIGFHEPQGNEFLVKHANVILEANQPRIFVPLCGKTRDIHWLLSKGCDVVGAELSEIAINQLFEELGVTPTITKVGNRNVFQHDGLTVHVGDIFELNHGDIGNVTGVYDRAALVALPEAIRNRYALHITNITQTAPKLLVTFDYDQHALPGPPFCVSADMINDLYKDSYHIEMLERASLQGGLKGKVAADSLVFKLTPHNER